MHISYNRNWNNTAGLNYQVLSLEVWLGALVLTAARDLLELHSVLQINGTDCSAHFNFCSLQWLPWMDTKVQESKTVSVKFQYSNMKVSEIYGLSDLLVNILLLLKGCRKTNKSVNKRESVNSPVNFLSSKFSNRKCKLKQYTNKHMMTTISMLCLMSVVLWLMKFASIWNLFFP